MLKQTISLLDFRFFKGCLPQILLGPFLNALSQIRNNNGYYMDPCGTPALTLVQIDS